MQVTDQYNERWRSDWFTSDFWHILNLVFLCVLAFLWRPSAGATRFAYSALEGMPLCQGDPWHLLYVRLSAGILAQCIASLESNRRDLCDHFAYVGLAMIVTRGFWAYLPAGLGRMLP